MDEKWLPVPEVPAYQVSTLGRIKHNDRMLDPAPRKTDGYVIVTLSLGARRKRIDRPVHVLVAKAFLPNPKNLPVVNHKNWSRSDNRADNLEWVSIRENRIKWSPNASPGKRGRRVIQKTLTGVQVALWDSATAAANAVKGRNSSIVCCCRGKLQTAYGFRWSYCDDSEEVDPTEEWREIEVRKKGWKVSTLGRVKTHTGYTTKGAKGGPYLTTNGVLIHLLVARAFCPNPNGKKVVNHKDGNKYNNCASNLEWVTQSENIKHAFETGLIPCGSPKLKKAVARILPSGEKILYESIVDAERRTGITGIAAMCRGIQHSSDSSNWVFQPSETPKNGLTSKPHTLWPTPVEYVIPDDDPIWEILGLSGGDPIPPDPIIPDDDPFWQELGL